MRGLGAALGTVGVAVPSDEHYETKKRTPRAMCVSTVTVAPTGSCELLGGAQSLFITTAGAAALLTMHKDGLGAALGTVGVVVPSDEHCETMRRSEITVVTRGPFRWVVGERTWCCFGYSGSGCTLR